MNPRDPMFGVRSKFFESQWLGHQARVQAALKASRGPFGSPEGLARMARNLSGFNAIQRQLQASTQLSDVFSQSHRFTEVFGGGLSQAISRITRLSSVPLAPLEPLTSGVRSKPCQKRRSSANSAKKYATRGDSRAWQKRKDPLPD